MSQIVPKQIEIKTIFNDDCFWNDIILPTKAQLKTWHSVFWKNNDPTDIVDCTWCSDFLFVARVLLHETTDVPICVFWCSLRKEFEMHCFRLHRMSKKLYALYLFSEWKNSKPFVKHPIQILMKCNEVFTKPYVLSLLFGNSDYFSVCAFLKRSDRFKKKSSFVTLHLCTFHLWAQQTFRSRSVLCNGSKEKIWTESWHSILCTECSRSHCPFSGRGVVRSVFASRTGTSTWTSRCLSVSTQSRFFPLNMFKEKSLLHYCPLVMSGSNVFDMCTSCPPSFFP